MNQADCMQKNKEVQENKEAQEHKEAQDDNVQENKETQEHKEAQEQVDEEMEAHTANVRKRKKDKRTGSQRKKTKKEQ